MNYYFSEWKPIHGYRQWLRFIGYIIYIIALIFIDGCGLLPIIMIKKLHLTHLLIIILMILCTFLIYVLAIYLAYRLYKKCTSSNEVTNFTKHPILKLSHSELVSYGKTFGLLFLTQIAGSLLNYSVFHQHETKNNAVLKQLEQSGKLELIIIFILSITLVPICEELIFRGCIINCFFKKYRHFYSLSIIVCGFLFSLVHLSTNPISFLIYMLAGMILAYGYEKSGSLKTSIACHATNNLIAGLLLLA